MSIPFPPLPARAVVDRHIPTGIVTYGYTDAQLRARDIEVAKAVLEGAAQRLETQAANIDRLVSRDSWDASASSVRQGACYVRALEVSHD